MPAGAASNVVSPAYVNSTGSALPAYALVRVTNENALALVNAATQNQVGAIGFLSAATANGASGSIILAGASSYLRETGSPVPTNGQLLFASRTEPGRLTSVAPEAAGGTLIQAGTAANNKVLISMRLEVGLN